MGLGISSVNLGQAFDPYSVRTTGDQRISGIKTFADDLIARSGIEIYFSGDQRIGNIISGNWNNSGIAYTGIQYNIGLSSGVVPSATNSLLNVSVNNTGVFSIDSRGFARITKNSSVINYSYPLTVRRATTDVFTVRDDGATEAIGFSTPLQAGHSSMNADGFAVRSVGSFRISSDVAAFSPDVFLRRDGPGIFSQYNGINPQQYRIYNATGTNSGEFGVFGWQITGASGTPNAFVIGAQATQSGILRDVILSGRNIRIPTGDLFIGTTGGGTSRILMANPLSNSFYQITPSQYSMTIGQIGGTALTIDSNFISSNQNFTLNGAGYLFGEGANRYIGLRDGYGGNNTLGENNQGFNIYKVYSGAIREFLTLGWTGFTGIIGTAVGTSGILRDLIITGANINLASSGVIIPNPTVPTSTGSEGTRGQISWNDDFIYVCVSGNSWKRAALTTW